MIKKIYAVRDILSGYNSISLYDNDNLAIRDFGVLVNAGNNQVSDNAADFSLYCLGELDTDNGILTANIEKLIEATAVVKNNG